MGVSSSHWYFLTGTKENLYAAARESYLLDDEKHNFAPIDEQFIHTQLFALADKNGQVRGMVYDGLKNDEIEKLKKAIRELLKEPKRESHFVNSLYQNNPN
jgi:protein SCO1/2